MRRLIIIAVPALVAGILSVPASADPGPPAYESSDPARGEKTHTKTTDVSVTFNEILDPSTAELSVSACGETVDDGRPPTATMETISIGIGENPVGTYTVAYKVSGADDTPEEKATPTEGSYTFIYHSKQCGGSEPGDGNGDGHGHHDGGDGPHDGGHGGHRDGGKDHGRHEGKHGGTKHEGHAPGGHGGERHDSASHTDHAVEGTHHTEDHSAGGHSSGSHDGGHHKEGDGHHSGSGKSHHHSGGHHGKGHADEPGNAGGNQPTAAAKPSKPNNVVNLLLVLLIPAAMGAVGGRMLRKARVRPVH